MPLDLGDPSGGVGLEGKEGEGEGVGEEGDGEEEEEGWNLRPGRGEVAGDGEGFLVRCSCWHWASASPVTVPFSTK